MGCHFLSKQPTPFRHNAFFKGDKMLQENHKKLQLRDFCGWNLYDPARTKTWNNSLIKTMIKSMKTLTNPPFLKKQKQKNYNSMQMSHTTLHYPAIMTYSIFSKNKFMVSWRLSFYNFLGARAPLELALVKNKNKKKKKGKSFK